MSRHSLSRSFRTLVQKVAPRFATLALTAFLIAPAAHAQSSYKVTDLGQLPNTDASYPTAMDTDDPANVKVVGLTTLKGVSKSAYYWTRGTGPVAIGVLPGGTSSLALSVNSRGDVVGRAATLSTGANAHAIYWNPKRGEGNLLDLAPETQSSSAVSINEHGIIIGFLDVPGSFRKPVFWTPNGQGGYGATTPLPLPAGAIGTDGPTFITDNGDIIGDFINPDETYHPCLWKNVGTPQAPAYTEPIVIPQPAGSQYGSAGYINAAGQVAGFWNDGFGSFLWNDGDPFSADLGRLSLNTQGVTVRGLNDAGEISGTGGYVQNGTNYLRAFVWLPAADTANGLAAGLNNLGTLGGSSSRADGPFGIGSPINNKGQVVGRSHTKGDRETHAFIWDRVNKMRNLNSTALTPNKATFSYLWIAHGISDTGYVMGRGITAKGNHTRSFLLTPVW